jgi:hypothetical protein
MESLKKQAWSAVPLLALAAAYLVVLVGAPHGAERSSFDPLATRCRTVEQLIVARQFREALPLALELRGSFPDEPQVSYWLASIHHGLGDTAAEARACQDYVRLTALPASGACASLQDLQ